MFRKGQRVNHPRRGDGTVANIDSNARLKYHVLFDNGELHRYSETSAEKFTKISEREQEYEDAKSAGARFCFGQRVSHARHGKGMVVNVDMSSEKPYTVEFENGERHSYSEGSSVKLKAQGDAAKVRAAFEHFDSNRSGDLDFREVRNALLHYGINVSEETVAALLPEYDDRADGTLDLGEFEKLVTELESPHGVPQSNTATQQPEPQADPRNGSLSDADKVPT